MSWLQGRWLLRLTEGGYEIEPSPVSMKMALFRGTFSFLSQEGYGIFFSHDFTFPPVMENSIVSLKNAVFSHNISRVLDPFPVRKFLNNCIKMIYSTTPFFTMDRMRDGQILLTE
jgi:hypothetical protein